MFQKLLLIGLYHEYRNKEMTRLGHEYLKMVTWYSLTISVRIRLTMLEIIVDNDSGYFSMDIMTLYRNSLIRL